MINVELTFTEILNPIVLKVQTITYIDSDNEMKDRNLVKIFLKA